MKRFHSLWINLTGMANIHAAAVNASKGKRSRPDIAEFLHKLESNLPALGRQLANGTYSPGGYFSFQIHDPKPRLISAAPFRDRVVHHALTQILEPIFGARFSPCSCASRGGFGTHRALNMAHGAARRYPYVLKCDVAQYFASLDHAVLLDLIARKIKCKPTLALIRQIVDHSPPSEPCDWYFPGDTLFTPYERRRGIPLGNQTSQFFANVYLDPLDQYLTRVLRVPAYCRYVDDFVVFGATKDQLKSTRDQITSELDKLRLRLHPAKSRIHQTKDGFRFLGWRLFPTHRRLCRENVARARRRLHNDLEMLQDGAISMEEFRCRLMAWIGHAKHGDTNALIHQVLDSLTLNPVLQRQNAVRGGSWNNNPRNVRASVRNNNSPEDRNNNVGFRCVRDEEPSGGSE
jgi:retron-type reverse transcriptase